MPTPLLDPKLMRKTLRIWLEHNRETYKAARAVRVDHRTFSHRVGRAIETLGEEFGLTLDDFRNSFSSAKREPFTVHKPPQRDMSTEELVLHRKKQFAKKLAHHEARKLIGVSVSTVGPIGILHFGDPHVDDDGTDIIALERHRELCLKTEGLFAANVGDVTNNWVGRLAYLWSQQATTKDQAWQLAEWLLSDIKWLYLIGGNHDAWSGDGDPLKWIVRQTDTLYQSSEVRLELRLPNGQKPRINARHDHAGHSQFNPAHGPMKATIHGLRDHIAICGHKHKSGYGVLKDPQSGITCHSIQVASYKLIDRFAMDKGFRDQHLSPCALTTINTQLPETHPDYIKVFWDADEGVDYLKALRKRARV